MKKASCQRIVDTGTITDNAMRFPEDPVEEFGVKVAVKIQRKSKGMEMTGLELTGG